MGVAIGASGVRTLWDRRGEKDRFGRTLQSTRVAAADMAASAAVLFMGEASEGLPAVVLRGFDLLGDGAASDLNRPKEEDVLRRRLDSGGKNAS